MALIKFLPSLFECYKILKFVPCDSAIKNNLDVNLIATHIKEYFLIVDLTKNEIERKCTDCDSGFYKKVYNKNYYTE